MSERFADRVSAGRALGQSLEELAGRDDVLVLGLPRGGLPVARQVAIALRAPLDALVVRKLGAPGQPELAIGALASGGILVRSDELIERLGVSDAQLNAEIGRQRRELQRREDRYRGRRPFPDLSGKTVVLVDDGLATGSTMEAAVRAVRSRGPATVIVAVPVAPRGVAPRLLSAVDRFVALMQPPNFSAVGQWYRQFNQTSDEEVREILRAGAVSD